MTDAERIEELEECKTKLAEAQAEIKRLRAAALLLEKEALGASQAVADERQACERIAREIKAECSVRPVAQDWMIWGDEAMGEFLRRLQGAWKREKAEAKLANVVEALKSMIDALDEEGVPLPILAANYRDAALAAARGATGAGEAGGEPMRGSLDFQPEGSRGSRAEVEGLCGCLWGCLDRLHRPRRALP